MMKTCKKLIAALLLVAMVMALAACGASPTPAPAAPAEGGSSAPAASTDDAKANFTPLVLKWGNQHPEGQYGNTADLEIEAAIEAATEGRITFEHYANQALGDYLSIFDELMVGSVDCAHISPSDVYDTRVSATMLPYLGSSYDELVNKHFADGCFIREELNDALAGCGIELLGIFCEGFNGVGSTKELTNYNVAGEEKGIVVRVPMLDVYALSAQDLGFRVSSLPYSDTYTAMQTGVVDGWTGGTAQANYLAMRDLIHYYYDYKYNQEATMILFSAQTWEKILPEDQEAIRQIVGDACVEAANQADALNTEFEAKLEEAGITVVTFTEEELAAFAESCRKNAWPSLAGNYPDGWLNQVIEAMG